MSLTVSVDGRPLDIPHLRTQGIGRFADALLTELAPVARERGGRLVLLREKGGGGSAYRTGPGPGPESGGEVSVLEIPRPRVPDRFAEYPDQILVPRAVRRAGAQVHHSLSIYRAPVFPRVPSVVTIHDVIPLMWPDRYLRTGVMHRMLYAAARRATRLIAVSERARADAVEHLGVDAARIDVVHEAAADHFRPCDPHDTLERLGIERPYVLYVGGMANLDPRKNVEQLIEGFAAWSSSRQRPETLVLAGRVGPAGEPLRGLAKRSGAPVHFTGFVSDADLPALYCGASCTVTATLYEGFGLPALESLSCGVPLAAYDVGALREVAGPGAILVREEDVEELMRAVEMLCDDPDLRTRLGDKGRVHASTFSWRSAAERTWDVYERALTDA